MRLSHPTRRALRGVGTFAVVVAAVGIALIAATLYELSCDENCTSNHPVRTWQLVVAIAALAGVIGVINLLHRQRRRAAWALCAVTLALYALWIVLLVLW